MRSRCDWRPRKELDGRPVSRGCRHSPIAKDFSTVCYHTEVTIVYTLHCVAYYFVWQISVLARLIYIVGLLANPKFFANYFFWSFPNIRSTDKCHENPLFYKRQLADLRLIKTRVRSIWISVPIWLSAMRAGNSCLKMILNIISGWRVKIKTLHV